MRHDPHPEVMKAARVGDFRSAMFVAYRLATGNAMPSELYHAASSELDDVFGAYDNLEIACTAPAALALVKIAKLSPREAELVSDLWLMQWRNGRDKNCPRSARRPTTSTEK